MKTLKTLIVFMMALSLAGCSTSGSKGGGSSRSGSTQLRPYTEKTLANGMRVLYVEDGSLPYTTYQLMMKSGATADPGNLPGLTLFVSELLQKGTTRKSATQIADELGRMGADYGASVSADTVLLSASSLASHAEELLSLFHQVVTEPTFSESEVNRMRQQILAGIQKRTDNPDRFTDTVWQSYLFGSHPYARPASGTLSSVKAIKRKHIIQHYLKYYRPNNAMLAVVGKYTPELQKQVESLFGQWESRDLPPMPVVEMAPVSGTQIRVINKPDLVQSQIRIGHKGIRRNNEDFVALRVANTVLGGAFASRLVDRVRKEMGLTYSIWSNFDARLDYGPFEISTFTKNETVGVAVAETLKTYKDYVENGAKSDEVNMAKGYLKGMFPQAIETAEKLSVNLLLLRLHGIPDSYLTTYIKEIERVSVSDVNRVIKKYMDPTNVKVLVYSNARDVVPQLLPIGLAEVKEAKDFQ